MGLHETSGVDGKTTTGAPRSPLCGAFKIPPRPPAALAGPACLDAPDGLPHPPHVMLCYAM